MGAALRGWARPRGDTNVVTRVRDGHRVAEVGHRFAEVDGIPVIDFGEGEKTEANARRPLIDA